MTPLEQIWTTDVFGNLTAAIREQHRRHARIRKIVPAGPSEPGAYGVVVPDLGQEGGFVGTQEPVKTIVAPTRLRAEFRIRSEELEDIELATTLARRAARQLAHVEDLVLAYANVDGDIGPVNVSRRPGTQSLFARIAAAHAVAGTQAETFVGSVKQAVEKLGDATEERGPLLSPYAALITGAGWSDASATHSGSKSGLDVAVQRYDVAPVAQVPNLAGKSEPYLCVFPFDESIVDLVDVLEPTCSARGWATNGSARMVIESAFVLRIKDPSGIVALE